MVAVVSMTSAISSLIIRGDIVKDPLLLKYFFQELEWDWIPLLSASSNKTVGR